MKHLKSVVGLVGLALGALGAVKEIRDAKGKRDGLALANAAANGVGVLTGAALLIRSMRKKDGERA